MLVRIMTIVIVPLNISSYLHVRYYVNTFVRTRTTSSIGAYINGHASVLFPNVVVHADIFTLVPKHTEMSVRMRLNACAYIRSSA